MSQAQETIYHCGIYFACFSSPTLMAEGVSTLTSHNSRRHQKCCFSLGMFVKTCIIFTFVCSVTDLRLGIVTPGSSVKRKKEIFILLLIGIICITYIKSKENWYVYMGVIYVCVLVWLPPWPVGSAFTISVLGSLFLVVTEGFLYLISFTLSILA